MPCPFNSDGCNSSCPLNKDNYTDACKLTALSTLPELLKSQQYLGEQLQKLLKATAELTDEICKISTKLKSDT